MKRTREFVTLGIVAALGIGLALTGLPTNAQAPATPAEAAQTPVAASVVSADQQPTKEQLAKLFDAMRVKQQIQSVQKVVPTMIQQQIKEQSRQMTAGANLTPEQQTRTEKIMGKYTEKAMSVYSPDEMIDDMTGIYQRHLSREDVDGMIAFFTSPAGQHLLDQQPVIMQEYMPLVMKRVAERSKTLTAEMMKEMAEVTQSAKPAKTKPANK
jgi:hypothetical protein